MYYILLTIIAIQAIYPIILTIQNKQNKNAANNTSGVLFKKKKTLQSKHAKILNLWRDGR